VIINLEANYRGAPGRLTGWRMSIQTNPEDIEQIRERLRKMSDVELRKFGRAASDMVNPTSVVCSANRRPT
jgi:hypothetical protein